MKYIRNITGISVVFNTKKMLRTIILQPYKKSERKKVAEALDVLCSPKDDYGWASAGVYAYWNYYTNEVLYIGLAIDLKERFKQHNGFYPRINKKTCKVELIEEYFKQYEKIGFSIIVQSPLSQPLTSKIRKKEIEPEEWHFPTKNIKEEGLEGIKHCEGVLIEAFQKKNGTIPSWNKMNGSISGQNSVKAINYEAIEALSNQRESSLSSRSTLFELADNPTLERFENFLHSVRIIAPTIGEEKAIEFLRTNDTYVQMIKYGYFDKKLKI